MRARDFHVTRDWAEPGCHTMERYLAAGGYCSLRRALDMTGEQIIAEVARPCVTGRGGAHFPVALKWSRVPRDGDGPRYLVVNADEGEPGTFKDRHVMEKSPHMVVEGMAIAARAVGAEEAFVYIRGEYALPWERMRGAVREAREAGYLGANILGSGQNLEVTVMRGAGAYICGEETGLLSSIEGGKGFPRLKPPFPATAGLYGRPTVVNNVETLAYLPHIIHCDHQCALCRKLPSEMGCPGLFCVSGHVERPGIYELAIGTPLREIVEVHAGGVRGGRALKAVVPGGSSSGVLTADELDTPMDVKSLAARGAMLGTAAVVVMDETTCMVSVARNLAEFYAHESCGQCTPCREGCGWIARVLRSVERGEGGPADLDLVLDLCGRMAGKTICAFADGAALAVSSYVNKFRAEFLEHLDGRCRTVKGGNGTG